jgi:hypothetical protein
MVAEIFRRETLVLREVGVVRVLSTNLSQGSRSQSMREGVILKTIFRVADKPKTEPLAKACFFRPVELY